ncbi:hypothetical protein FG379_001230 [Cryptosporidium bovis]|uniref:uncharacterized protein n=1 Tax=Cryptosporidium bovis TaxID=310047 RepID=UPI00351A642C|nr:hypothetical protein FG379_001230 [Cryptosporidium bovis]
MEKGSTVYNEILEFDFYSCSEKEYGELVHSVIDNIVPSEINVDKIFDVLKKKLIIQDDGKIGVSIGSRGQSQRESEIMKDIVVSDNVYFDCRFSLKKEIKKIIQSAKINSKITDERELLILKYVFSKDYQEEYEFYIVRHPNPDYNGCRTIAIGKGSSLDENIKDDNSNNSFLSKLVPLNYVSCVNKIRSKWEHSGRLIVNLMYSILNIIPRSIKQYIAVFQEIYPVSQRNSIDSYLLYFRILQYGIKLVPASTNILVRFLMDKLISLESEVNTDNPNLYTNERYEKWRQEELHNLAIRIKKGEFKDIISAKNYIQNDDLLRKEFSDKFTEEDINKNVQIIDILMVELFEFINDVCENGLKYRDYFENVKYEQLSNNNINKNTSQKLFVDSKVSRDSMLSGGVLSSSDFESSAVEDSIVSSSCFGSEYGKKEEQLYKQCVDLANTILEVYETKILSLQTCCFINYIPIYIISNNFNWCERYFQINFKKLFNPLETLMVRKMSVDYIISFILNYKVSSNFKFYIPCVKYLMQFLHEFVAHWNMERTNKYSYNSNNDDGYCSNKKKPVISKYNSNNLKNLFELYCHVVSSLCWLFSVISISCISHLDETKENVGIDNNDIDVLFVLESLFNPNRGFISFVLFGSLSPLESIDPKTPTIFYKSSVLLLNKIVEIQKDKDNSFCNHSNVEIIKNVKSYQYLNSVKLVKNLFEKNQESTSQFDYIPNKFLSKIRLRHSDIYINSLFIPEKSTASLSSVNKIVLNANIDINPLIDAIDKNREETNTNHEINCNYESKQNKNPQNLAENKGKSEDKSSVENTYGKMKSSILPQQSLWESVWGSVPVSQEELESDLYITKNKKLRVNCGIGGNTYCVGNISNIGGFSHFEKINDDSPTLKNNFHNSNPIQKSNRRLPSKVNSNGKNPSLLEIILSSEAYKRSKISITPCERRKIAPRRTLS